VGSEMCIRDSLCLVLHGSAGMSFRDIVKRCYTEGLAFFGQLLYGNCGGLYIIAFEAGNERFEEHLIDSTQYAFGRVRYRLCDASKLIVKIAHKSLS
jgi:hypothetical protein